MPRSARLTGRAPGTVFSEFPVHRRPYKARLCFCCCSVRVNCSADENGATAELSRKGCLVGNRKKGHRQKSERMKATSRKYELKVSSAAKESSLGLVG